MTRPHVLLIDNYDSFSFNLVDAFSLAGANVDVYRNSLSAEKAHEIAQSRRSALIVLSPGPGTPNQAGCCIDLIRLAAGNIPVFGVCLGHQAIVEAFGGTVGPAESIVHGKKSHIEHDGHALFAGLPAQFDVGRYHSLAALRLPETLRPIATGGSIVMALTHQDFPIFGVQFHPESILTTFGQQIVENALRCAVETIGGETIRR